METTEAGTEATPSLKEKIVEMLRSVYDPEVPVNIYEMGLIYDVAIDEERRVAITMTLTSPACPVAETLPVEVEMKVNGIPEVAETRVDIVWEPPWDPSKMSEAARLELGM